ncbi:MAG: energy transducer TonB [Bacteroidales bacterium]|nr:energy transducer TonB [Bacteroidales bacterium]
MNKHFVKVLAALALAAGAGSQAKAAHSAATTPYALNDTVQNVMKNTRAAQPATYQGGVLALYADLSEHLTLPATVKQGKQRGKVVVRATIGTNGLVTAAQVVQGMDNACNQAAVAAVKALHRYNPARHAGKQVQAWTDIAVFLTPQAASPFYVQLLDRYSGILPQSSFSLPDVYEGGFDALQQQARAALTYPEEAWRRGQEGTVTVAGRIMPDHRLDVLGTVDSVPTAFDATAIAAVHQMSGFLQRESEHRWQDATCLTQIIFTLPPSRPAVVATSLPPCMGNSQAEQSAAYPGGEEALQQALIRNFVLPAKHLAAKLDGSVALQLCIDEDGSIGTIVLQKGMSTDINEAVMRAVQQLPRFIPARHKGEYTAVSLPLTFRVQYDYSRLPLNERVEQPAAPVLGGGQLAQRINEVLVRPDSIDFLLNPVEVQFVVKKDGSVCQPVITGALSDKCNAAAMQAISRLGAFTPARHHGAATDVVVRCKIDLSNAKFNEDGEAYTVFQEPHYRGGEAALLAFLHNELYADPAVQALDRNKRLDLWASYVVDSDGQVKHIKVLRGYSPAVDAALVKALGQLQKFTPAKLNDTPVATNHIYHQY